MKGNKMNLIADQVRDNTRESFVTSYTTDFEEDYLHGLIPENIINLCQEFLTNVTLFTGSGRQRVLKMNKNHEKLYHIVRLSTFGKGNGWWWWWR